MKGPAVILDVGGNVDCKPMHLFQFAIMGEVYARCVLKKDRPRVGLLSNGEEEGKGNELTRETHALLKASSNNYVGYVEGRDIYQGEIDVVVTDGFVGNVVLKLSEGLVEAVTTMLKNEIMASVPAKIGYMLSRGAFRNLSPGIDFWAHFGGFVTGIVLGLFFGPRYEPRLMDTGRMGMQDTRPWAQVRTGVLLALAALILLAVLVVFNSA